MTGRYQEMKLKYDGVYQTLQNYLRPALQTQYSQPQPQLPYGGRMHQRMTPVIAAGTCAEAVNRGHAPWKEHTYNPASLMMDAPPSMPASQVGSETPSFPSSESLTTNENGMLMCERCEREFKPHETAKYLDHISKCTDD